MRRSREIKKGASYQVTALVNRGENIFESDKVKGLLFDTIIRAKDIYKFSLKNMLIISNQVEFIIKPDDNESLSKIMQWILGVFAASYRRTYNVDGIIWYDRFRSYIVG